jgi:tRNA1(Val) A37 N6-methylase TrmN6
MPHAATISTSEDRLLGGRVSFRQPATGYRVAIDPVLLAAAVPGDCRGLVVDLGCGAGAAMLCVASRVQYCRLVGVERDTTMASLAQANAAANGFGGRASIVVGDIRTVALAPGCAEEVIANPPYLEVWRAAKVADPGKEAATLELGTTVADWLRAALELLPHKGKVTFIHRADRLDALLAELYRKVGDIEIVPLWPKAGVAAKRVIVRARKGVGSSLRLGAGLVLHEPDGSYTAAAQAILRDGAPLPKA